MVAGGSFTQSEAMDRSIAIRICREVSCLESNEVFQWAFLDQIVDPLGLCEEMAQRGIRYAAEQGWLVLEGEPVHSVVLCHSAASILAGEFLTAERATASSDAGASTP